MARRMPPRGWRLGRLLTLGGLIIGIATLLKAEPTGVSATGKPRTPPSSEALKLGFEQTDIGARDVALILAGIAATTAVVIGIIFVMFWRFNIARDDSWSNLTPQQTARSVPPAPHLQIAPMAALAQQRARENRLLHSYGWTSVDHSTARIPIDRAMALTVGQSLDAGP